jgi:hypothetical protein
MANAERKYEIIIKGESGGKADGYESNFPEKKEEDGGTFKKVYQTFSQVWAGAALARSVFSWQLSLVGRDTGNSDLQQKINAAMTIGGQVLGIAGSFAFGGPIAGVMAVATTGLSYLRQYEQYNYDKMWEGYELAESRRRAGPSLNRSRRDT